MAYSGGNIVELNRRNWPGPNCAGSGKATIPDPDIAAGGDTGLNTYGINDTIFVGRNAPGVTRNSGGPNVAGAMRSAADTG